MPLREWVKEQGRRLGFHRVGIAPVGDLPELAFFSEWQARNYAGTLDYMGNPKRADVRLVFPGARSVICCALVYDTQRPRSTEVPHDPERGWLSRYAWGDDYHKILTEKLVALRAALAEKVGPGFEGKLYVDTGPVLEHVYGKYAGLGWQGKNTCLLDADLGSFFFIGVLVTNLELAADVPLPDGCGSCTLCLEACPTGALVEPYVLDARRCISYLTIELREAIPEEFREPMGRHVFGCDICQDVCPYNRRAWLTDAVAFQPRAVENRKAKLETRQPLSSAASPSAPSPGSGDEGNPFVVGFPLASHPQDSRGQTVCEESNPDPKFAAPRSQAPLPRAQWFDCRSPHRARVEVSRRASELPSQPRTVPIEPAAPSPAACPERSRRAPAAGTTSGSAAQRESLFHPRLEWLASLSEEEFREVFRDSAVKLTKWRGLLRNVLVAMGNSGNQRFRTLLEKFAASYDPLLAEHARWALERLSSQ